MWADVHVILIIGIWNEFLKGSQQFDEAQWENKLHMWEVFNFEQHKALDRNFIDKWGALLQLFFDNLQKKFQVLCKEELGSIRSTLSQKSIIR